MAYELIRAPATIFTISCSLLFVLIPTAQWLRINLRDRRRVDTPDHNAFSLPAAERPAKAASVNHKAGLNQHDMD